MVEICGWNTLASCLSTALTNIHGLSEVVRNGHHVKFDSEVYNGFVIKCKDGKVITFSCSSRGMYVKDDPPKSARIFNSIEGFIDREVVRAKTCRKLVHDLDGLSYDSLLATIQMNLIKNNLVITKDVKLTEDIFGRDVSILK